MAHEIQYLKITDLKLLEGNPRTITGERFEKLKRSLEKNPKFFEARPCLVNNQSGENVVYAGNQRLRASIELRWDQVPCIVESLTVEEEKERTIRDNVEMGEWDMDLLANEWEQEDLVEWGALEPEAFKPEENEDSAPAPPKEPKTRLGDLYQLGDHFLLCGDSTEPETVSRLLADRNPILMVTDPPYGVEYDPEWREGVDLGVGERSKGKVQNDDRVDWTETYQQFPGAIAYVWHAGKYSNKVLDSLEKAGMESVSQIIWRKQHFVISRGDYHWQHEPCWYVVRKGQKHNWQGDRKQTTVWDISNNNSFGNDETEETFGHGTQKPVDCMRIPILNNSEPTDYVYDPFGGSGTTLIACETTKRKCLMVELDPGYCDVIVERWENLTDQKAVLT